MLCKAGISTLVPQRRISSLVSSWYCEQTRVVFQLKLGAEQCPSCVESIILNCLHLVGVGWVLVPLQQVPPSLQPVSLNQCNMLYHMLGIVDIVVNHMFKEILVEILLIFHIVISKTPPVHLPWIDTGNSKNGKVYPLLPALGMDLPFKL